MNQDPKPEKTYIAITGYGPFENVTENPSATLKDLIIENFSKIQNPENFEMLSSESLAVTDASADEYLQQLHEEINAKIAEEPKSKFLVIHIGVLSKIKEKEIRLESTCYNCKNFTEGNLRDIELKAKIENFEDLDFPISTLCDLETAVDSTKIEHPYVKISNDPGRYLCNYI
jgi:pyrrolidone-carboxylate peptidase